jgi:hypothetical protein
MWIVQLDELVQHAIKIRNDNVMRYRGKELKAFEMGLNIMTLLMKHMVEDMVKENKDKVGHEYE